MRLLSICLLVTTIHSVGTESIIYTDTAMLIYDSLIDSKTLFQKPPNDSTNSQKRLKSFDSFVNVHGYSYYFLPESIVWAAYDHPETIDLSNYNQSCLTSWAKQYNKSIGNCATDNRDDIHIYRFICGQKSPNACEKKRRVGQCSVIAGDLGQRMDDVVFPDGRSVETVIWNCSIGSQCCDYGCCVSPVFTFNPRSTTQSPIGYTRDILYILLKVFIISTVFCGLLCFCVRYYAYLHQRARVQNGIPIPAKNEYTSFPAPPMPYVPYPWRGPVYPSPPPFSLSFEAAPPYVAPPPYTERPVDPLPKVV